MGPGRDIRVYGVGLVVGQVISAATTPLFTRQLGPSEFGSLELLTVMATLLGTCALAGTDLAAIRLYYEVDDDDERRSVISTGLYTVIALGLASFGVAALLAPLLADLVAPGGDGTRTIIVGGAWVAVSTVATYSIEILRVQQRGWAFLVSGLLRSALGGAVAVILVLTLRDGVTAVYLGLLVGAAIATVFNLVAGRRLIARTGSRTIARRMLTYGLPLVPTGLAGWSMMLVDRLVVAADGSVAEVGHYAVANRIAALMLLAVYGFRAGWSTWSLAEHRRDPRSELEARALALTRLVAGVATFGVALATCAREVVIVVGGEQYLAGARCLPYLVIALVLFATIPVTQTGLVICHRTRTMAVHSTVAAVVNAIACLVLVPPYGIVGAAVATVVGFGWQAVGYLISAQRVDPAPYRYGAVAATIALMVPWTLLGTTSLGPFWVSVGLKTLVVAAFPLVLVLFRIVDTESIAALRTAVRTRIG